MQPTSSALRRTRCTTPALLAVVGLLLAAPAAQPASDGGPTDAVMLSVGRSLSADFWAGRLDTLWARMSPEMRERFGGRPEGLAGFREQTLKRGPGELVSENVKPGQGNSFLYLRTFRAAKEAFVESWTIEGGGSVAGLYIQRVLVEAPSHFLDYRPQTAFHLPVKGTWWVLWGGRTVAENRHAALTNQRFAMDLLIEHGGTSHRGDGKLLGDYYCWGQEVLAPADGVVVSAVDQFMDQLPSGDKEHPAGNAVVLNHGGGEFSLLAHLQKGSVAVKPLQQVRQGQLVGRCGCTGNSSEPHLHVQAMNGPDLATAESLPMPFIDILVDGKAVARAELIRGQMVSPAPPHP